MIGKTEGETNKERERYREKIRGAKLSKLKEGDWDEGRKQDKIRKRKDRSLKMKESRRGRWIMTLA